MPVHKMLVAYDGSSQAQKAMELAREIASTSAATELILVHILMLYTSGSAATGIDALVLDDAQDIEDELNQIADSIPNNVDVKILRGTSPADLIVNCAKDNNCDVIIMGSRGKGGISGYLGSVSNKVINESPVTVIIAKDQS